MTDHYDSHRAYQQRLGLTSALMAFSLWGFAPLYFKLLEDVLALEIIAHRIIWSVVILGVVLGLRHRVSVFTHLKVPYQTLLALSISGAIIGLNWLIFVYAVNSDRVLSTSLGYFINPLVSVALGMVFFKEHLNGLQVLAVALAAAGTLYLTVQVGDFPWIALTLAFSFGLYGLIRKQLDVGPMVGLFWETLIVLPLAGLWLFWRGTQGLLTAEFDGFSDGLLMVGTGAITVMPLLLFAAGVRRLNLSTIGILQYIAPSLSFCMAVFLFKEPFSADHAITFGCIWSGLLLYTYSSWVNRPRV